MSNPEYTPRKVKKIKDTNLCTHKLSSYPIKVWRCVRCGALLDIDDKTWAQQEKDTLECVFPSLRAECKGKALAHGNEYQTVEVKPEPKVFISLLEPDGVQLEWDIDGRHLEIEVRGETIPYLIEDNGNILTADEIELGKEETVAEMRKLFNWLFTGTKIGKDTL